MKHRFLSGLITLSALITLLAMSTPSLAATTPISFDGFEGSGFAPNPTSGQLDSDIWSVTGFSDGDVNFGGTGTTGDFAMGSSTGHETRGGIYAFDVGGGNMNLGVQPIGDDFTPGAFILKVTNTTGSTASSLYVAYKIWAYNDQPRANSLNFSYSTDGSNYTPISGLDFTTPEAADASPAWVSTDRTTTITGINLASGAAIYLKWTGDDVSGSGSRDEYGIDDIEVRMGGPTAIALRSLTASATSWPALFPGLGLLLAGSLLARRRRV